MTMAPFRCVYCRRRFESVEEREGHLGSCLAEQFQYPDPELRLLSNDACGFAFEQGQQQVIAERELAHVWRMLKETERANEDTRRKNIKLLEHVRRAEIQFRMGLTWGVIAGVAIGSVISLFITLVSKYG